MEKVFLSKTSDNDFSLIVNNIYNFTSYNKNQYPNYDKWYFDKCIPRVKDGYGDIIVYTDNNDVIGVIILKKTLEEKKICTFYVLDSYRNMGIGKELLNDAFNYLETTKPVITIPHSKVHYFNKIIDAYNWELDRKIDFYSECEDVFNEKLELF